MSGDHGITLEEHTPFGVVGAVTPGHALHPDAQRQRHQHRRRRQRRRLQPASGRRPLRRLAVAHVQRGDPCRLGIENLVCTVEEPTSRRSTALTKNEHIRLLCVTGGPGVVKAAMKSGKRAICAGPGNPPVIVDGTGCLAKAAADIIKGASYDNNLLCIGEKAGLRARGRTPTVS
jgi:aldehyde dehydrogenase